jgi:Bifunctional DNA primase/polymerase, N-terminal
MSSRSRPGSASIPNRTWPSPPAPPDPTFSTSTSTALQGTASPPSPCVRTPSGGLHVYFTGTGQRSGRLRAHHLDFKAAGGYILTPPSQVNGKPYQRIQTLDGRGSLDWQAVTRLLEPDRQQQRPASRQLPGPEIGPLARWVAAQPEGNRNDGLFWAANRALDADPAADLSLLAAAARQAGLSEPEITRTLNSARRTGQARPNTADRQAEGAS